MTDDEAGAEDKAQNKANLRQRTRRERRPLGAHLALPDRSLRAFTRASRQTCTRASRDAEPAHASLWGENRVPRTFVDLDSAAVRGN